MSYIFRSDRTYRMPTHFGPSLGPRQGLDGRRYTDKQAPKATTIKATFEANGSQLEPYLPPGFQLREPHRITFDFCYVTGIEWLAGRGYNTFGVSIPATYQGQHDRVEGELLLVLWENMADPIITGREDLGFAKVYCELPEPQIIGDSVLCRASWDGCQFASLKLSGLKEIALEELPAPPPSEGTLHYKYIPKTNIPGEADAAYAVLTPADWPNVVVESTLQAADTSCNFRQSTWEELPTLVHIVNALSALELGQCVSAAVLKTHGGKDLSDQRILR